MTAWAPQRRHPRYLIHLPFIYRVNLPGSGGSEKGWTLDLSEGGACVELAQRLPPRTPLHLCLQTDRGAIEVDSQVVWADIPAVPGGIPHGVVFTHIAPDHLPALRNLLSSPGPAEQLRIRLQLDLPITCRANGRGGPPLRGRTADISHEGLLLLLPEALTPGTELELTLDTPVEPLTMPGKIIWVEPAEGATPGEPVAHGLRFTSLRWCSPLVLASLLARPVRA